MFDQRIIFMTQLDMLDCDNAQTWCTQPLCMEQACDWGCARVQISSHAHLIERPVAARLP